MLPAQPKQDEGKTVRSAPFLGVVWLQQDDVDLLRLQCTGRWISRVSVQCSAVYSLSVYSRLETAHSRAGQNLQVVLCCSLDVWVGPA